MNKRMLSIVIAMLCIAIVFPIATSIADTNVGEVSVAEDTDILQRADPVFNYAGVSMGGTGTATFEAGTSINISTFKVTSVYLMKLDGSTWVYHSSLVAPTATGSGVSFYTTKAYSLSSLTSGTYRIYATFNADGNTTSRYGQFTR